MDDYMKLGTLVPIGEGWFIDTETNITFQLNEDGEAVDENGRLIEEYISLFDEDGYLPLDEHLNEDIDV